MNHNGTDEADNAEQTINKQAQEVTTYKTRAVMEETTDFGRRDRQGFNGLGKQ